MPIDEKTQEQGSRNKPAGQEKEKIRNPRDTEPKKYGQASGNVEEREMENKESGKFEEDED